MHGQKSDKRQPFEKSVVCFKLWLEYLLKTLVLKWFRRPDTSTMRAIGHGPVIIILNTEQHLYDVFLTQLPGRIIKLNFPSTLMAPTSKLEQNENLTSDSLLSRVEDGKHSYGNLPPVKSGRCKTQLW